MENKDYSELSDEDLKKVADKMKIWNAIFIGLQIGIIIYSISAKKFGLLMLIPMYFIYRLWNSKKIKSVDKILKERNLK